MVQSAAKAKINLIVMGILFIVGYLISFNPTFVERLLSGYIFAGTYAGWIIIPCKMKILPKSIGDLIIFLFFIKLSFLVVVAIIFYWLKFLVSVVIGLIMGPILIYQSIKALR